MRRHKNYITLDVYRYRFGILARHDVTIEECTQIASFLFINGTMQGQFQVNSIDFFFFLFSSFRKLSIEGKSHIGD